NPAAGRSRQKSFRGLAKCAAAAAETRPGLMPQKSNRSPGARTSGMADLGGFGLGELGGVTRFEELLEADPQGLAFDPELAACTTRLEAPDPDGLAPNPPTPGKKF